MNTRGEFTNRGIHFKKHMKNLLVTPKEQANKRISQANRLLWDAPLERVYIKVQDMREWF